MLQETNIDRAKLTTTLKDNLKDHIEIYDLALANWKEEYSKYVADFAKKVKSGDFKVSFSPPKKPTSYAKNYEDVISQLDMSSDQIIKLNESEFNNYILDEWGLSFSFYSSFLTASSFQTESLSLSNISKMAKYTND